MINKRETSRLDEREKEFTEQHWLQVHYHETHCSVPKLCFERSTRRTDNKQQVRLKHGELH